MGFAVGFGVGALGGAVVGPAAGGAVEPGVGLVLLPGRPVADGPLEGWPPNELPGGIEANVPGARPEAIATPDGGESVGPSADGAQAAIRATTSSTPMAIEGRLRFP